MKQERLYDKNLCLKCRENKSRCRETLFQLDVSITTQWPAPIVSMNFHKFYFVIQTFCNSISATISLCAFFSLSRVAFVSHSNGTNTHTLTFPFVYKQFLAGPNTSANGLLSTASKKRKNTLYNFPMSENKTAKKRNIHKMLYDVRGKLLAGKNNLYMPVIFSNVFVCVFVCIVVIALIQPPKYHF